MDPIHDVIIGMSHVYFRGKEVTPDAIREYIGRMKATYSDHTIDEVWLFRKLESIHSVFVGFADTLDDATGHEEWFNPSTNVPIKRELEWHFWNHYREYLASYKGWPPKVVESLDSLSSEILSRIEDPTRSGWWDRRGMVMGSVQSGKTANYTALITKAADAGYKLFIVLAGVHNSLRSQTQSRLNEEFLGYDLDKVQKLTGAEKRIGVRNMFPDHGTVFTLTNASEKGDFSKVVANQSGIFPDPKGPPILLVIKKNVSILRNLLSWVPSVIGRKDEMGNDVITDIPMLLIDDECDYASINTKEPERDELGNILEEWDPTTTNRLIRKVLKLFQKSAYIGYTATPYANIFIHRDDYHERYGEDLFPRSFIISLPQPSNYMGPDRVFGLEGLPERGIEETPPLPLLRYVWDHDDLIPDFHKPTLEVERLPGSIKEAIKSFMISCAVRSIRKEGTPHNSMLVHVTRFTLVQRQVFEMVEAELRRLVARTMGDSDLSDFKRLYDLDYSQTSMEMDELGFRDAQPYSWEEVLEQLHDSSRVIKVKLINGTVRDTLDYRDVEHHANLRRKRGEDVPWTEKGASLIAIGGDKLSRGLTLEGLTVSYYLRASKMYDTLMQMGRWFGYREGYTDLCRIFTTEELASWYRHIAGATRELREEIEYMAALGETPENFGLKVRSHPGRLFVTSPVKSRNKIKIELSYDGKISETVVFDPRQSGNNREVLARLITSIGMIPNHRVNPNRPRYRWSGVPSTHILAFLSDYKTQDEARRLVNPEWIAGYIERQNQQDELNSWDVVIVSNPKPEHTVEIAGYRIGCVTRTPLSLPTRTLIRIRRLVSPADELEDMTSEEIETAIEFEREQKARKGEPFDPAKAPSNVAIRHARPADRGLLLVYLPHKKGEPEKDYGNAGNEVVGFAISFPRSENAIPVEYWVNPVYIDEEQHYT